MEATAGKQTLPFIEFGKFRLIPAERLLLRGDAPVHLPPKVFDALLLLIEYEGRLIEKEKMLDHLWPDAFVEEATLARTVSTLRKMLGENGDGPIIETVPKRGYRFVAPVRRGEDTPPAENTQGSAFRFVRLFSRPVLMIGLLFVAVTAAGLIVSWNRREAPPDGVKSIAVLPFRQVGSGESDRSLELGMADAVIARLGNNRQTVVRSTGSVSKYLGTETDAARAGEELQAEAVLEGTIFKDGDRVRVTARLVRSDDGSQMWADTFDSKFTDIFAVQDSISTQIARSLNLKFTGESGNALPPRSQTAVPEAYQFYMKGRYFWDKRTPDSLLKAIENFERAIALDPDYALAHTGLADCYILLGEYRVMSSGEAFSKGRIAAETALKIDERLVEARCTKAYILGFYDWDFAGAEAEFIRAIEQNPNYAVTHQWYGELLQVMGRFDESLAEFRRAEQLDPWSLIVKTDIAGHFYSTRQFDQAIEQSRKILEMDPNFGWGYGFLWLAHKEKGELPEAIESHMRSEMAFGTTQAEIDERKVAYARSGWKGYWDKWLEQADRSKKWQAIDRAAVHLTIGDKEQAFKLLEQSLLMRERWILNLKHVPMFEPLHGDPRFDDLIRRIGLS